jgi:hypothetical protein
MRIAITGAACQGKSTLIKDMLKEWPDMKVPDESYRDTLDIDNHSKNTTEDVQWDILNSMIDIQQKYTSNDKILFDRCSLDNIAYSLWGNIKGSISDEFVEKCIPIVKESMRFVDIIFFLPITKIAPVEIEDNGEREIDTQYVQEIDNILKTLYKQWQDDGETFFVKDDKPAMIEIFGNKSERIEMLKLYIDNDGDAINEQGILNPGEMEVLQKVFGLE